MRDDGFSRPGWPDGPGDLLRRLHGGDLPPWLTGEVWSYLGSQRCAPMYRTRVRHLGGGIVSDLAALLIAGFEVEVISDKRAPKWLQVTVWAADWAKKNSGGEEAKSTGER